MTAAGLSAVQPVVWAAVPVLVAQGRRVRRATPVLPEAEGPEGTAPAATRAVLAPHGGATPADADADPPPLRLLVLGESTAAGVGAPTHERGLSGGLAARIAEETGRGVRWRVVARSGAAAREVGSRLLATALAGDRPDLAVVLMGVNDTLRLTPLATFRRRVATIAATLRVQWGVPVVFGAVPRMDGFPVLPPPTRQILGLRSRAVDAALSRALREVPGTTHAPMPRITGPGDVFAEDGFHPGPRGYRVWADHLAGFCTPLLPAPHAHRQPGPGHPGPGGPGPAPARGRP